jgi:hypothetical protein
VLGYGLFGSTKILFQKKMMLEDVYTYITRKIDCAGTIAVRTTCGKSAQEVYGLLKSRHGENTIR